MNALKRWLRACFLPLESACEAAFGPRMNPITQLGTLGWFLFWIVTASGIYVYAFFDTGVTQAWQSLEALSRGQWWLGGIMRSLHRYASDALVVVVLLHALREFAMDRMRGNRWFPWVTGVPLVWFLYACGITGYWLVWDRLAQYVAIATSEWLDSIGIFAEPIARNFLDGSHLSGRFFTLMAYIHIALPLAMLLAMWIHIQRHAHARVNPPRALGIGTFAALVALSIAWPAMSQAPANLDTVPSTLGFDWFYLTVYPLLKHTGGRELWAILVGGSVLLTMLPWMPPLRKAPPARVDLANCNGCARCFADCPFGAITMVRRSDGLKFEQEAQVTADMCMSCGICVGACPTATPFRRVGKLSAGIELPAWGVATLRDELVAAAARLTSGPKVVVFGCTHDAGSLALADDSTAVVRLPCVGMLPPPFLDFVLSRGHADGVLISGCAEHDCYERLGDQFTLQRIANQRDPNLRDRVPRDRVAVSWNNPMRRGALRDALARFRAHLGEMQPAAAAKSTGKDAWRAKGRDWAPPLRYAGQLAAYVALAAFVGFLATRPTYAYLAPDEALLKLSFSHAGKPLKPCRRYTPEELARLPFNQRKPTTCERGRWPVTVELDLDGKPLYRGTHEPAGLWDDGPSSAYARFLVPAGRHRLDARLRDDGSKQGFDYTASQVVDLAAGQNFVVDFSAADGGFLFGRAAGGASQRSDP
ncbi:MAG TPA: cytochrome b N-terminal domain-containing protein [Steroidobacteraceae bacterium]|nr:cytochrome b N-terminal domain-containing protein [Steroidobacteraceae bacterium]